MVGVVPGSPESLRRAFNAGGRACSAGLSVSVCPYPVETAGERAQWLRGFSTAEIAAETNPAGPASS